MCQTLLGKVVQAVLISHLDLKSDLVWRGTAPGGLLLTRT